MGGGLMKMLKTIVLILLITMMHSVYAHNVCHHKKHHVRHHYRSHRYHSNNYYYEYDRCYCYDPDLATGDDDQCNHPDLQIND